MDIIALSYSNVKQPYLSVSNTNKYLLTIRFITACFKKQVNPRKMRGLFYLFF